MTVYSLDLLLSQFWTSPLFHVQFCCFLTCIQVSQEAGKVVWYSHLFKNFLQLIVIHTVKDFSIVSEAEGDEAWWKYPNNLGTEERRAHCVGQAVSSGEPQGGASWGSQKWCRWWPGQFIWGTNLFGCSTGWWWKNSRKLEPAFEQSFVCLSGWLVGWFWF